MTEQRATTASSAGNHFLPKRIGFGTSGLGTLTWDIPDEIAQIILEDAWTAGYRYFDTSPLYGFGLSELRLGRFLRNMPRADYVLSTKVGRYFVPPKPGEVVDTSGWVRPQPLKPVLDYSHDGFLRSLEQSYNRLGVSSIDIVFIHDLDRRNLGAEFDHHYKTAVESGFRALAELKREGVIKAIGVGLNEADVAAQLVRDLDLDLVMLAGRYTLLEQPALEEFLPEAEQRGIGVVDVGVFNSGILVKPPENGGNYDYGKAPAEIIARAHAIKETCADFGVEMPAAALHFPFGHKAVKSVVVGMSKIKAVQQNMDWFNAEIPKALWSTLKERGLLAADAPTPA